MCSFITHIWRLILLSFLLIQAKQRYNQRVISGVKAFLALDARNVGAVEAFFTSPDEGGWEDLSAAGYLLANAFRTSSTKAPDSLPSVKVCSLCLVVSCIVSHD